MTPFVSRVAPRTIFTWVVRCRARQVPCATLVYETARNARRQSLARWLAKMIRDEVNPVVVDVGDAHGIVGKMAVDRPHA